MIIGGEQYFSPNLLFSKSNGYIDNLVNNFQSAYQINFTFGGYYSILVIIDAIKSKFDYDSIVLLPSYMCPSILLAFKTRNVKYRFYKVDDDLYIDNVYLTSIIDDKVKAVLFIDYFGASQMERLQPVLDLLRSIKITIIQDIVQCLEINKDFFFGDFIFNSFRKFFPFEGSILFSLEKININYSKNRNKYIKHKRIGQLLRYFHVRYNLFSSKYFLRYLQTAEKYYHVDDIFQMPRFNINQLNKYNVGQMCDNQKHYFNLLFNEYGNKTPNLLKKNDFIPLGFVVKLNDRDNIRKKLFEQNIFSPIHWLLSEEFESKLFEKSIRLSKSILTIPLVGLTDKKYKYLYKKLNETIKNENIP